MTHTREANGEPYIITVTTDATIPARKTAEARSDVKY